MKSILRVEIYRAFHNKLFLVSLIGLLGLSLAGTLTTTFAYIDIRSSVLASEPYNLVIEYSGFSAINAWLPQVTWKSRLCDLFFMILPIVALLPYSWSLQSDKSSGYLNSLYGACGKRVLLARCTACFIAVAVLIGSSFLLSWVIASCTLPIELPDIFDDMSHGLHAGRYLSEVYYTNLSLYIICLTVSYIAFYGMLAVLVLLVGYYVRYMLVLLVVPVVLLNIVSYLNNLVAILRTEYIFSVGPLDILKTATSGNSSGYVFWAEVLCLFIAAVLLIRKISHEECV